MSGSSAVGGVRLAGNPLHFGHFVGTFAACLARKLDRRLLYVIKDTEPFLWRSEEHKRRSIAEIARSAVAMGDGLEVSPVLASVLLKHAWFVQNAILDTVNLSALIACHFEKKLIREGAYSRSVRNFLYPIDEAIIFTFVECERFYSNMDNERIVRFVRDVQHRLAKIVEIPGEWPETKICSFPALSFLPGVDYQRMATKNGNVLPINASSSELRNFCESAVRVGPYFSMRPEKLEQWRRDRTIALDEDFLPLVLLRVLGQVDETERYRTLPQTEDSLRGLAERIFDVLATKMHHWRQSIEGREAAQAQDYEQVLTNSEDVARYYEIRWTRGAAR